MPDKDGRSIRQVALLKWFVRKSYVDLPDEAVRRYAVAIYDAMVDESGDYRTLSQRTPPEPSP